MRPCATSCDHGIGKLPSQPLSQDQLKLEHPRRDLHPIARSNVDAARTVLLFSHALVTAERLLTTFTIQDRTCDFRQCKVALVGFTGW